MYISSEIFANSSEQKLQLHCLHSLSMCSLSCPWIVVQNDGWNSVLIPVSTPALYWNQKWESFVRRCFVHLGKFCRKFMLRLDSTEDREASLKSGWVCRYERKFSCLRGIQKEKKSGHFVLQFWNGKKKTKVKLWTVFECGVHWYLSDQIRESHVHFKHCLSDTTGPIITPRSASEHWTKFWVLCSMECGTLG